MMVSVPSQIATTVCDRVESALLCHCVLPTQSVPEKILCVFQATSHRPPPYTRASISHHALAVLSHGEHLGRFARVYNPARCLSQDCPLRDPAKAMSERRPQTGHNAQSCPSRKRYQFAVSVLLLFAYGLRVQYTRKPPTKGLRCRRPVFHGRGLCCRFYSATGVATPYISQILPMSAARSPSGTFSIIAHTFSNALFFSAF